MSFFKPAYKMGSLYENKGTSEYLRGAREEKSVTPMPGFNMGSVGTPVPTGVVMNGFGTHTTNEAKTLSKQVSFLGKPGSNCGSLYSKKIFKK